MATTQVGHAHRDREVTGASGAGGHAGKPRADGPSVLVPAGSSFQESIEAVRTRMVTATNGTNMFLKRQQGAPAEPDQMSTRRLVADGVIALPRRTAPCCVTTCIPHRPGIHLAVPCAVVLSQQDYVDMWGAVNHPRCTRQKHFLKQHSSPPGLA